MPFESLNCTNCGSGDVQEVKPGTYFCNHCETVFKHVDPTKISVGPAFCDHGNPIRAQCQICKKGMCLGRCDMVAGHKSGGFVRTQGFGYVERRPLYNVPVDGPFLSLDKLMGGLALDCGGLSHACHDCVIAAVPAAAEHIAAGALCQTLRCWRAATGKCPCCHAGFCNACSMPQIGAKSGSKADRQRGLPDGYVGAIRATTIRGIHIEWEPPKDTCKLCAGAGMLRVGAMAATICRQEYAGRLIATDHGYTVVAVPVRRKHQFEEDRRQDQLARQYAAEIDARLKELMTPHGTCDCKRLHAGSAKTDTGYDIFDDRDRVHPSAVSEVIWAQPVEWWQDREV